MVIISSVLSVCGCRGRVELSCFLSSICYIDDSNTLRTKGHSDHATYPRSLKTFLKVTLKVGAKRECQHGKPDCFLFIFLFGGLGECRIFVTSCGSFSLWHTNILSCGAQAPDCTGSVLVAQGLGCLVACEILVP